MSQSGHPDLRGQLVPVGPSHGEHSDDPARRRGLGRRPRSRESRIQGADCYAHRGRGDPESPKLISRWRACWGNFDVAASGLPLPSDFAAARGTRPGSQGGQANTAGAPVCSTGAQNTHRQERRVDGPPGQSRAGAVPRRAGLPGGYARKDETLRAGALRELREEAGIGGSRLRLEQLGAYGDPPRDLRGGVATVAYLALGPNLPVPVGAPTPNAPTRHWRRTSWAPPANWRPATPAFSRRSWKGSAESWSTPPSPWPSAGSRSRWASCPRSAR
ncbi:NUDIX domain-containing protein [Actinacidiphila bryophytorum]|uniref:NUDIX domain-containing protein n=1 Tax=Actinacidiphila bryophytorum TaxID=1436133 RepID=UPI002176C69B|nr:NUDIX domain-containing protein [Actinacidiphila bryophytorum]